MAEIMELKVDEDPKRVFVVFFLFYFVLPMVCSNMFISGGERDGRDQR